VVALFAILSNQNAPSTELMNTPKVKIRGKKQKTKNRYSKAIYDNQLSVVRHVAEEQQQQKTSPEPQERHASLVA
jgi:hypothetical protein